LLVVGGWIATILLSAVVLDHEMNEMFDEELLALVETSINYLDTVQGAGIPRTLGVETSNGERILRILSPDQPYAPAPWPPLAADGFHDAAGWRVLRRTAEGSVIEVAHSTDWRREEMFEAAAAFLYLAIPLVLMLLFGLRQFVAQTTAPVTALASAVAGRRPEDLSPVGSGGLPQELRPLAEAFDGYLARIGTLRKAERDFVANAAHELRTPLAALRGRLELSSDPDAMAAVETVDALTRRVERLLQLARLEAGVGIGRGPSDLLRILRLLIDDMRPASRHSIRLDDSDLDRLIVPNDADALAILLRNLLENALEHGTGEVRLRLQPDATLTIENPTTRGSLPMARFERGEGSGGSGLGLSIIDAMADTMQVPTTRTVKDGRVRYQLHFALHHPASPPA
jgi:two-component system OmpR family sensor kinase